MAELVDMMAYTIASYPENLSHEISNARLTKLIYLADWHSCLHRQRQISPINWVFDSHGPFVFDVKDTAEARPDIFKVTESANAYGSLKRQFALRNKSYRPALAQSERISIDYIIGITRKLYWDEFIKLVYSTHPVASSEKYSKLNLVAKAREYQAQKKKLAAV